MRRAIRFGALCALLLIVATLSACRAPDTAPVIEGDAMREEIALDFAGSLLDLIGRAANFTAEQKEAASTAVRERIDTYSTLADKERQFLEAVGKVDPKELTDATLEVLERIKQKRGAR